MSLTIKEKQRAPNYSQPRRVTDYSHIADKIGKLPVGDRTEIIGQAIGLAAGTEPKRINPLAGDLFDSGLSAGALARALGVSGSAGLFTSSELLESVRQSLILIRDDVLSMDLPEHWAVCGQIMARDLAPLDVPQIGEAWAFDIDGELSEIPATTVTIKGESAQIHTIGAIAYVTRQAILNCQWDLIGSVTRELLEAVQRRERSMVVDVLTGNPVMADGVQMFAESRGNLLSEVRDDNASVGALFSAFRGLTGRNGEKLTPRVGAICIPSDWFVPAQVLRAQFFPGVSIFDDPRLESVTVLPPPDQHAVIGLVRMGPKPEITVKKMFDDRWGIRVLDWTGAAAISTRAVQAPAQLGEAE